MRRIPLQTLIVTVILAASHPVLAQNATGDLGALRATVSCKSMADAQARLACFDARVPDLEKILAREGVVILDRKAIEDAQKSAFGKAKAPIPGVNDDSGHAAPAQEINAVEGRIQSVRQMADGKWVFTLEDGARWVQTEYTSFRTPKPGDMMRIRKAALGSFMANINNGRAIRVRRQN